MEVTVVRSRETCSTSVVATALPARRAAGSARKAALRWATQEVSIVMAQRIDRLRARVPAGPPGAVAELPAG